MRKFVIFQLILMLALSVSSQKLYDSTWVIGEEHIGKIVVNMDENDLYSIFPKEQIKVIHKTSGASEYSVIQITLQGENKVALELETMCIDICLISIVELYSTKFKTVEGIGVGSKIGDVRNKYTITSVMGGDNCFLVYTDDLPHIGFAVKVTNEKPRFAEEFLPSIIPDDAIIEWIYMY